MKKVTIIEVGKGFFERNFDNEKELLKFLVVYKENYLERENLRKRERQKERLYKENNNISLAAQEDNGTFLEKDLKNFKLVVTIS